MTTWTLDPSHSTVEFSAKHMMFTTVKVRFADAQGTVIATDENDPRTATVDVTMKAESIDTRTEQRDQHLRSADFLDAGTHPTVTCQSPNLDGVKADSS